MEIDDKILASYPYIAAYAHAAIESALHHLHQDEPEAAVRHLLKAVRQYDLHEQAKKRIGL
jgi:hypothetical protein